MKRKWVCENWRCSNVCTDNTALSAPDPFNPGETLVACPKCREVGTLIGACDFKGCKKPSSSGSPTKDGYVFRCYEHRPERTS